MTERRQSTSSGGILLLLDADHFKRVNDTYGHAVGDICLRAIAHRLQWNLRQTDVAGRLGGEEFAIFLADANVEQARVIGERIGQPIPFDGGTAGLNHLSITLSIGAVRAEKGNTLDELLMRADDALYAAKRQGRARMVFWDASIPRQSAVGGGLSAA